MNSGTRELVKLTRNVKAVRIPDGDGCELFEGTEVMITQALGGTFTVMTMQGVMASIPGKDADALGKEVPKEIKEFEEAVKTKSIEELAIQQLKTCYDPEIPHNMLDLGLIYEKKITGLEDGGHKIYIKMTLTAPGCGMGDHMAADVRNKLLSIPEVKEVEVEVVFDPPWSQSMMAPALRREMM